MTLAVAAVWPWGLFSNILRAPGQPVNDMVVVATDSRFTELGGKVIDDGKKMYRLGDWAELIFAGDVMAAEDLVDSLSRTLTRHHVNYTELSRMLPLYARSAYNSEKRRRAQKKLEKAGPLRVMIPTRDGYGVGRIIISESHKDNFKPSWSTGVEVFGHPTDVALYKEQFNKAYQFRLEQGLSLDSDERLKMTILTDVISPLRAVIESPLQSGTVGGRIQCTVITQVGLELFEMSLASPPKTDQAPKVELVSVHPRDVKTYRRPSYYRPSAAEACLVSENLADTLAVPARESTDERTP